MPQWFQYTRPNGSLMPRHTAWYTKNPCSCVYKYGSFVVPRTPFSPLIQHIAFALEAKLHLPANYLNSCNANMYSHSKHSVDWHSDNEILFGRPNTESNIVSVSFGASREFSIRSVPKTDHKMQSIVLNEGDVLTMEGQFQWEFQHAILPGPQCPDKARINLTFRNICHHFKDCELSIFNDNSHKSHS